MPRRAVLLTAAASGAVALAPAAVAAPIAPRLTSPPPPDHTVGDRVTLTWDAATFSSGASERAYVVRVRNVTAGTDAPEVTLPITARAHEVTGLADGTEYAFTVLARERTCGTAACAPTDAASATVRTTMDATAPAGTVSVNDGAEFTRTPSVTLTLAATDAAPGGGTGAGVSGVQITDDGAFTCVAGVLISPDCPVVFAPSVPWALAGPDGVRTVSVRYRDAARLWTAPSLGNGSAVATDTIVLDRVPPAVALSLSTVAGPAGVRLDAAATASDATSGPDAATAAWTFGDGETATGLTATHTYGAAGTYAGSFTVNDRAGNTATHPFTVTVNAAPGGDGAGTGTTGGTSQPQQQAGTATPTSTVTTPPPAIVTQPTVTSSPTTTTPRTATTKRPVLSRIAAVKVLGTPRARGTVRVRVTLRTRGPLRVAITRTVKKRTKTLRWVSRSAAGPKPVTVSLKAPAAGRYTVVATSGKSVKRAALRVRPAAR
ncbi:MAG: fibronectin type III domain-containing protein [Thermoleophilia bacterium]|nr:fibronectin type III domain-containing protein [Thermoleophilia bacterium]